MFEGHMDTSFQHTRATPAFCVLGSGSGLWDLALQNDENWVMDDAWNLLKSNILCSRTVVGLGRALGTPRCDVWQTVQEKDCERHMFLCVAFGVTSTTKGNKHHNLNLSQNRVCFMHLGYSKYSKVKTRMKLYQFPAHTYLDFDLPQSVYSQDSFLETKSENSEGAFW